MDAQTEKPVALRGSTYAPANPAPIRLLNAGLNERDGEIFGHGWLDLEGMDQLRVDDYQREVLAKTGGKKSSIRKALEEGTRLPDIMLGMRGQHFSTKGSSLILEDPVYIVDGLQRVFNIKQWAEENPDQAKLLRIGAEVRFGSTKASEKELFLALNTLRIGVSPNIILRNMRDAHPALLTLYGLSNSDKEFTLYGKVTWSQRMGRGELITALMLSRTSYRLHRFAAAAISSDRAAGMGEALDSVARGVGLQTFRSNVKMFYELLDACWPLDHVEYREKAVQVKGNFMVALATFLSDHTNFWKGSDSDKLFVDAPSRKKLSGFPILDPEIARLAGAGNMTLPILVNYLTDHFNKGKRVIGRPHKRSDNR